MLRVGFPRNSLIDGDRAESSFSSDSPSNDSTAVPLSSFICEDVSANAASTVQHAAGCACCSKPEQDAIAGKPDYEGPTGGGDTIGTTAGAAGALSIGGSVMGVTDFAGDQDWYAITVTAGQRIQFDQVGAAYNGAAASPDTYLYLYNGAGTLLASNDDFSGLNSRVSYTFATAGTYYISAGAYGSETGGYQLSAVEAPAISTFTIPQIADQLLTGYWGGTGRRWAANNTEITYNVTALTAERAALARLAYATWADVTGLTFTETTGAAEMTLDDNQSGAFASSTTSGSGSPRTIVSSSINVATSWSGGTSAIDSYTFQTFIHEIGHALGLGHAGNYNGSATYGVDNHYENDTWQYSVMSYFDQSNYNGASYRYVFTPQMADIYALQQYYGAGTARSTDTTYGFNVSGLSGATASLYDFSNALYTGGAPSLTLYDAGGNDTLDVSGYSQNQLVDLNGGAWSNVGGRVGNIGIYTTSVIENATGGSGSDTLTGNAAANNLRGLNGNDTINGNAGNDTLEGGADNDIMDGGADTDTATYASAGAAVSVSLAVTTSQNTGSAGNDTLSNIENLIGSIYNDTLTGSSFANSLFGGDGNDTLDGGSGNDILEGGAGNDSLNGGADADTASYAGAATGVSVTLLAAGAQNTGGAGTDTLSNIESLIGSAFNDTLTGNDGANSLNGGDGNDSLIGGLGNDSLIGGVGIDTVSYAGSSSAISIDLGSSAAQDAGGAGIDTLSGIENIIGSDFDDTLTSDSTAANILRGGLGNDRYYIYETQDQAIEEAGQGTADRVEAFANVNLLATSEIETIVSRLTTGMTIGGSDTANRIDGNTGNDTLNGNGGNDTLNGNGGNDTLNGLEGHDALNGGDGDDVLNGGDGNDVLNGGADNDTASYATAASAVNVSLLIAVGQNTLGAGTDTLTSIEGLIGSAFDDTLNGNNGTNTLTGGAGNDLLNGRGGLNTMIGGAGNDLYYVNAATDIIVETSSGGTRDLIYAFSDYTLGAGVYVEQVIARLTTGQTLTGNELNNTLQGNTGGDTLNGGAGNDTLDGRVGADVMSGGTGNDKYYVDSAGDVVNEAVGEGTLDLVYSTVDYTLAAGQEIERLYSYGTNTGLSLTGNEFNNLVSGGQGNDTLNGGAGSDTIYGNGGNDRLVGGAGIDTLFGHAGADVFVLQNLAADRDVLRDFEAADQVEVSASLFGGGLVAGSLAANQFASNATGVASTADQRFIYNNTNGALYFDADGSGATARVQIASLTGIPALTAADFTVVV